MTDRLQVLIADDHPIFRDGLRALLATDDSIELVGEAADGTDVQQMVEQLQPDIVLMDLHMPGVDGVAATREIVQHSPHVAIIVLTMFDDEDSVFAAMRAGARGYLLKGTKQTDLIRAIHLVASGGALFGPAVAQRMIEFFARPRRAAVLPFPQLTDREHEILDLIAQGQPNTSIAARLAISEKTVRNHVSNIFTKLAVADRAQAVVRAREAGLGTKTASTDPDHSRGT
jgi:DNA-binding NarL/FixJ family response regulator